MTAEVVVSSVGMQTSFTLAQLADPDTAEADRILRACVHCGFCTATCPTYVLLGDELDSPRGRIYLIKDMLENDRPATAEVVKHIDRCLSCLACMTTCPSGVTTCTSSTTRAGTSSGPTRARLPIVCSARSLRVCCRITVVSAGRSTPRGSASRLPACSARSGSNRSQPCCDWRPRSRSRARPARAGAGFRRRARGAGASRCWTAASGRCSRLRSMRRPSGFSPGTASRSLWPRMACCGALVHHLGRKQEALDAARRRIDAWVAELDREGLDAILVTASGCGTMVKDYGHLLRTDFAYADRPRGCPAHHGHQRAPEPAQTADDARCDWPCRCLSLACSLQHGQNLARSERIAFQDWIVVKDVAEGHLCCGFGRQYNILQPELARRLRERKLGNIEKLQPHVIAAGNIGCMTQIAAGTAIPVVHTVELIDWATGPVPEAFAGKGLSSTAGATAAVAM